jgi:hypothetical protein
MATAMKHTDVQRMMASFAEAKIVNLDIPLRVLVESAQRGLPTFEEGSDSIRLHIVCCNEYFLVTDIVAAPIDQIRASAAEVRDALGGS